MKSFIKKAIALVLSASVVSCFAVYSSALTGKYGDVDNNSAINSSDALDVLNHAVGTNKLTGDAFTRADVNGDKAVNSSDALSILSYAIGKIKTFDVQKLSGNEILALYSSAVSKARTGKPSYIAEGNTQIKDVDATVEQNWLLTLSGIKAADMEKELEDEMKSENSHFRTVCPAGSSKSLDNLPALCTLTDASLTKSVSMEILDDGNYYFEIKFNDEKNPKVGSPLYKAMGVADYETTLNELEEESEIDGIKVKVTLNELSYSNCWITCVINPKNNQFVSYDSNADMFMKSSMSVGVNVTTQMKTCVTTSLSEFTY